MVIKSMICFLLSMAAMIAITCIFGKYRKWMLGLLILYGLGVLYFTLLSRTAADDVGVTNTRTWNRLLNTYGDVPSIFRALAANRWFAQYTVNGIILNILLFVPMGFFLPQVFQSRFYQLVLAALLSSLAIETAQYIFRLGWFDLEDVADNVLGAAIGYCGWQASRRIICRKTRDD